MATVKIKGIAYCLYNVQYKNQLNVTQNCMRFNEVCVVPIYLIVSTHILIAGAHTRTHI